MTDVVVLVASYRRPAGLARLLASLGEQQLDGSFRVVVVDNDPDGSARPVVEAATAHATYVPEPRPGVAAARNAGLDAIEDDDVFAAFVDDDQTVPSDWLRRLVEVAAEWRADVVGAPVVSQFPTGTPRWILRGGFYTRAERETGAPITAAGTGNVLIRTATLERLGSPRFDESFSLSGGEDTDFFRRLHRQGARMVWCADAVSVERVEPSRLRVREVVRRAVRGGTTHGRLLLRERPRPLVLVYGMVLVLQGGLRTVLGTVRHGCVRAVDVVPGLDGAGVVLACLGRDVVVYRRHG